jgi:hypothetical protein
MIFPRIFVDIQNNTFWLIANEKEESLMVDPEAQDV